METLIDIYTKINFIMTLMIAEYVCGNRLVKRKYWYIFLPIVAIAELVFSYFLITYLPAIGLWFIPFRYLILFITSFGFIFAVFDTDFWSGLIAATLGYAVQHLSYQSHSFILSFTALSSDSIPGFFILAAVFAAVLVIVYFLILRKLKKGHPFEADSKLQLIFSLLIVICADFLSLYAIIFSSDSANVVIIKGIIFLFSDITCVFGITLEFAFLKFKEDEKDMLVLRQMVHSAKKQLALGRENIDIINVKCHDLKHQINAIKTIDEEELKKINDAIEFYDNDFHTLNDALDVVLTEKSLLCKNEGIRLTCLINGELLSKMSESDIYSFFGNAIDNAREALASLPPEEKSISITSYEVGHHAIIRIENYCNGEISFDEGMPQTTKSTKYHGFGTKSMKIIAEKYGGNIKFELKNKIFTVSLVLINQTR